MSRQSRKMNVFENLLHRCVRHGNTQTTRNQGQHVRSTLKILKRRGNPGEAVLDLLSTMLTQLTRRCRGLRGLLQLSHMVAKGKRSRHATGRGMWLIQQPYLPKRYHHIADGRRTQTLLVLEVTSNSLRGYRFASSNVHLDNGCEHQPLARTDSKIEHRPSPDLLP